MMKKMRYIIENYRMILHLLFGTGHFGTNNRWWSPHVSIFSRPGLKKFTGVIKNYKMMRARAFSGFIPLDDAIALFPAYAARHGYKTIDPEKAETPAASETV